MLFNAIISLAMIAATPQEHQVENVIVPKEVKVNRLDDLDFRPNHKQSLEPVEAADRHVTLIVPNTLEGSKNLLNVLKTKDNLKELIDDNFKKFHLYEVPFTDLKSAEELRALAKKGEAVQMYPTFKQPPYKISGVVIVNIKLLVRPSRVGEHKNKLEAYATQHNLVLTELAPDRFALQLTDKSDVVDVFALLDSLQTQDFVQRTTLDYTFGVR